MSTTTIAAQILLCQLQLLEVCLEIKAMSGPELSTDPWQKYISEDYDTPEDFCDSCLVDLNDRQQQERDVKFCWFPMTAPRKRKVIYLEALRLAEEFLVDPKNEYVFGDRMLRILAASSLVSLLQPFDQSPSSALVELSESQ